MLSGQAPAPSTIETGDLGVEAEELRVLPTAVFFDLLSTIGHALNELETEAIDDADQEEIFEHGDRILLVLERVRRRRKQSLEKKE
jgi:hypothetical protein